MSNDERRILNAIRASDPTLIDDDGPAEKKINEVDLAIAVTIGFVAGYFAFDIFDLFGLIQ